MRRGIASLAAVLAAAAAINQPYQPARPFLVPILFKT